LKSKLKNGASAVLSVLVCTGVMPRALALKRGMGLGISEIPQSSSSRLDSISNVKTLIDEVVYSDDWIGVAHAIRFDFANGISGRTSDEVFSGGRLRAFEGTLGLQFSKQTGVFQPFFGAGILIGGLGLTGAKPLRSSNSGFLPGETVFSYGYYAEGAFDFIYDDLYGVRLGAKFNSVQTRPLGSVSRSLELNSFMPYAAAVFTFRGCNPIWFLYLFGVGPREKCNA
jgi:hypothetical protein